MEKIMREITEKITQSLQYTAFSPCIKNKIEIKYNGTERNGTERNVSLQSLSSSESFTCFTNDCGGVHCVLAARIWPDKGRRR